MSDEPISVSVEQSYKRILKAEWSGAAREGADYYCCMLECGHHHHCSEDSLRSPVLCLLCCKQALAEAGQL